MPHDAYVRIPVDGLARVRSLASARPVHVVEGKQYCRLEWDGFEAPENWLRDTSRELDTDALWLVSQKQVDSFAFQHWTAGELKRRLTYGVEKERVWEKVDGSPEPWEAEAFFSSRALERRLRVMQLIDTPLRDKTADELRRVWAEQRIEVGLLEPAVSASSAGSMVVRHYDLPA